MARNSVLPELMLSNNEEEYLPQSERGTFESSDPMVNLLVQNLGHIVSANKRSDVLDRIADTLLSSVGMGPMLRGV